MKTPKEWAFDKALPAKINEMSGKIVDAAYSVHRNLGPGLTENVYELCFAHELKKRGLEIELQKSFPILYDGINMKGALRLDILVEGKIVVELKAVETVLPLHRAQLLTYLKLTGCPLGLLINFNVSVIKDGIRRVVLT